MIWNFFKICWNFWKLLENQNRGFWRHNWLWLVFQARSLRISKMKLYRPKLNVLKPFYCISNQKNPPLLPTQPAQLCWATKLGKGGGFRWLELQSYNFEGSSFGYRCFIFEILSKISDMLPDPIVQDEHVPVWSIYLQQTVAAAVPATSDTSPLEPPAWHSAPCNKALSAAFLAPGIKMAS